MILPQENQKATSLCVPGRIDTISTRRNSSPELEAQQASTLRSDASAKPGTGRNDRLGIPGKSCNPPSSVSPEEKFRRLERWALQAVSREILDTPALRTCCHAVIPSRDHVDVWKTPGAKFHYGGLITCGSVWVCPVCGAKITERRRLELCQAFANHREKNGDVLLLTLTAPHYNGQSLNFLLNAITNARRKMLNRKPWKRLASSMGVIGRVRGLEVTHSFNNGWHVHFHVLLFTDFPVFGDEIEWYEDEISKQWQSACLAADLPEPSRSHGVKLENGSMAAQYVGKWGLEHEMTKSHVKKGHGSHTPFDFLREILKGEMKYAGLFKEYAQEFKGRRQLVWSDGLRALLGLDQEKTDEEVAAEVDTESSLFAKIPLDIWKLILNKKKRGEVLEVCREGLTALHDYLIDLCTECGYFGTG